VCCRDGWGEGDGAAVLGGDLGGFDDDDGAMVAALAEVEADEEFALEHVVSVT
jgi:hypothetical protein